MTSTLTPPPPALRKAAYYDAVDEVRLRRQLLAVWENTGDENLQRLALGRDPVGMGAPSHPEERMDAVCSCLMDAFRTSGDADAFALLFELTQGPFLRTIAAKVRSMPGALDPQDVLQEVFLNIYRYPTCFRCEQPKSFRNWGHRIVQNTLCSALRSASRHRAGSLQTTEGSAFDPVDSLHPSPALAADHAETAATANFAYLLFLNLYLRSYQDLSEREQRALQMAEVQNLPYREIAVELGATFDVTKMVIFRARRKIFRGMTRSLSLLRPLASM